MVNGQWRPVREAGAGTVAMPPTSSKPSYRGDCPPELEGFGKEALRIQAGCISKDAPLRGQPCPSHMVEDRVRLAWGCTPPGATNAGLSDETKRKLGLN